MKHIYFDRNKTNENKMMVVISDLISNFSDVRLALSRALVDSSW